MSWDDGDCEGTVPACPGQSGKEHGAEDPAAEQQLGLG